MSTQAMVLFAIGCPIGFVSVREFIPIFPTSRLRRAPPKGKDEDSLNKRLEVATLKQIRWLFANQNQHSLDNSAFGERNPFTLAWLLPVLTGAALHDATIRGELAGWRFLTGFCESIATAVDRLTSLETFTAELLSIEDGKAAIHAFPAQRALQLHMLAKCICESNDQLKPLAENKAIKAAAASPKTVRGIGEWFRSRLLDQLAFATIRDAPFDAAELAFSLEGYLLCADEIQDRRNHDPDVVDRAFSVLSARQENNPYWRPLKPLVTTNKGFALLPLSVEIVNSLFRTCWLLKLHGEDLFSTHVKIFHRYFDWVISRQTHGTFTTSSGPVEFTGWHSEHIQQPGSIHVWETSQVAIYLLHYRDMLQKHLARRALEAART